MFPKSSPFIYGGYVRRLALFPPGEYARIPGWLRDGLSGENRIYSFARGWRPLVLGRVLLRAGEYAVAIGEFKTLLGDEVCGRRRLLLRLAAKGDALKEIAGRQELSGSTGIGELGLSVRPAAGAPFSLDLGVRGYVGKREGVTGSLQLKYEF
jgi:hypothetical protein